MPLIMVQVALNQRYADERSENDGVKRPEAPESSNEKPLSLLDVRQAALPRASDNETTQHEEEVHEQITMSEQGELTHISSDRKVKENDGKRTNASPAIQRLETQRPLPRIYDQSHRTAARCNPNRLGAP